MLLQKDGSIAVHQKNLQNLMTEIYKTTNQINPAYMGEIFVENGYALQSPYKGTMQAFSSTNK